MCKISTCGFNNAENVVLYNVFIATVVKDYCDRGFSNVIMCNKRDFAAY